MRKGQRSISWRELFPASVASVAPNGTPHISIDAHRHVPFPSPLSISITTARPSLSLSFVSFSRRLVAIAVLKWLLLFFSPLHHPDSPPFLLLFLYIYAFAIRSTVDVFAWSSFLGDKKKIDWRKGRRQREKARQFYNSREYETRKEYIVFRHFSMPRALPATSVSPFPEHTAHSKCPRRTEASIGTHPVPILVTPLTRTGPRWGRWRGATEGKSRREVVGRKLMMERIAPATACLILLLQLLPDVYARIDSLNYLRTLRCIYTD